MEAITRVVNEMAGPALVIAGHYSIANEMRELSHECAAESMGFELGVSVVAQALAHHKACYLVLWINDIGVAEQIRKRFKQEYQLPENYQKILSRHGLDISHVIVMFESTMRNKASGLLRKLVKRNSLLIEKVDSRASDLVRCVQSFCEVDRDITRTAYVIKGPNEENLVVKEGSNPKCNLILATFFHELQKQYSPSILINVFNEVYAYRIRLGIHVSQKLLDLSTPFYNIFCDGYTVTEPYNSN